MSFENWKRLLQEVEEMKRQQDKDTKKQSNDKDNKEVQKDETI